MGHPNTPLLFGVPSRSSDGRLWTRYPQGSAPNPVSFSGAGAVASVSAAAGSAIGGGSSEEWADVYLETISGIGSQMAVGVRVGMRPVNLATMGQQLTAGNGASMEIVASGAYDGVEPAVRIYPPTTLVSGEAQYASWLRNLDLWNNGARNIAQLNVRWMQYWGSTYYSHAPPAKVSGVFAQDSFSPSGGARRQAVWESQNVGGWSPYKYWGTTSNSAQYYPGGGIDTFPDSDKLMQIGGAPAHANSPPRVGGEWVCMEQAVDLRQNRGNANGMNKLVLWTSDGVVDGRFIQAPANWDPPWSFTYQYISGFEGLGFYFNTAGTANANNYVMHSHVTFCADMDIDELIGPPAGFVQ